MVVGELCVCCSVSEQRRVTRAGVRGKEGVFGCVCVCSKCGRVWFIKIEMTIARVA